MTVVFDNPSPELRKLRYPATNYKVIKPVGRGQLFLHGILPQATTLVPDVRGVITAPPIYMNRMAFALMKVWDIARPFVYHDVRESYVSDDISYHCDEGLNLTRTLTQLRDQDNEHNVGRVRELIRNSRVRGTSRQDPLPRVLTHYKVGNFVDGQIRFGITQSVADIYTTRLMSVKAIHDELRAKLSEVWELPVLSVAQSNALIYREDVDPSSVDAFLYLGDIALTF